PILERADEFNILAIDGWRESKGVQREWYEAACGKEHFTDIIVGPGVFIGPDGEAYFDELNLPSQPERGVPLKHQQVWGDPAEITT
ncbi:unnamed protein product, partial [marine sediment metagenome]